MKYTYLLLIFLTTNSIYGAQGRQYATSLNSAFSVVENPQGRRYLTSLVSNTDTEETLALRIFRLPKEIRSLIFEILKNINKDTIKLYALKSIQINEHKQQWYNIQHYFAFKNYGTECTHIVAFYPKKDTPRDQGTEQTSYGPVVIGSSARVFLHDLKEDEVKTIDCIEIQDQASCDYNGIKLSEKKPGRVYWLNPSSHREARIKEKREDCCIQ